jgi:hypothetical protein
MARGRERRHHALARTRRAFIPTLLTLLLVPASTAAAADYCVSNPACMAAGGTDAGNGSAAIQNALDAAEDTPEADRVLIGPGEFDAAGDGGYRYWASSAVEIAGAGAGKTIFTLSAPQSDVFTLDFDALSRNGRLHATSGSCSARATAATPSRSRAWSPSASPSPPARRRTPTRASASSATRYCATRPSTCAGSIRPACSSAASSAAITSPSA